MNHSGMTVSGWWAVREGLFKEETFGHRFKVRVGAYHLKDQGKGVVWRNTKCKGPEAGIAPDHVPNNHVWPCRIYSNCDEKHWGGCKHLLQPCNVSIIRKHVGLLPLQLKQVEGHSLLEKSSYPSAVQRGSILRSNEITRSLHTWARSDSLEWFPSKNAFYLFICY